MAVLEVYARHHPARAEKTQELAEFLLGCIFKWIVPTPKSPAYPRSRSAQAFDQRYKLHQHGFQIVQLVDRLLIGCIIRQAQCLEPHKVALQLQTWLVSYCAYLVLPSPKQQSTRRPQVESSSRILDRRFCRLKPLPQNFLCLIPLLFARRADHWSGYSKTATGVLSARGSPMV